jgi:hypothetical protein
LNDDSYDNRNHWVDYAGKGGPRQTRYLHEIHSKYKKLIDEQVGILMSGALNQSKSLRISAPESYAGSEDIEAFDSWPAKMAEPQQLWRPRVRMGMYCSHCDLSPGQG